MMVIFILFRRQLTAYFFSPMAYVTMVVFLTVAGLSFCRLISQSMEESLKIGDLLFGSMLFWLMVIVSITLITMQVFAEEKRSGTLESLLTAPVTDTQVVAAKYAAALVFFAIMCAPTALYVVVLRLFTATLEGMDLVPVVTGYAMLMLIGAFFIAFGLFASSLTRSQLVSAMLGFGGISLFFFADTFQFLGHGGFGSRVLDYLSSVQHMVDYTQGIVDTRPVVLYLSGIVFFLFAAVKVIESRQWK
ncbi:MAG: ABC transporter permease [Verrucomicrobia bacterium]|nr:ABC transporter permease [Verrucomicrobiota bacterium]MCG2681007.1 ABC transporter permease [Kiritimatiellia bacterium]MBU4247787.1 ABC transporter permease [Verrucomicrobiota bacterium]MBU4292075.1 ABC transporter permease [Verrucomicrobiota bacterium]MBU4427852.1 ABC transporter permease [Verrucomicrobiota bacterium]